MINEVDFDSLARQVMRADRTIADLDQLYGHVFALPQWHFIARGQFPNVRPYIASNVQVAEGQYMLRAFTDSDRLLRFAQENQLAGGESPLILSLPTDTIVDYLEQFIPEGVHGVWFNSDTKSDGFFAPLIQLRPIQEHLKASRK